MSTKMKHALPSRLVRLRRRFEAWRRTRKVRSRIPEPLWDSAVRLAGVYGLHRTAKTLRVNYYTLKKRVEREADCGAADVPEASGATFLELTAAEPLRSNGPLRSIGPARSMSTTACECTLELEAADGAKMRVRLSGMVTPDLVALSRSFLSRRAES